ncbi:MAG TPA: 2-polyprenyl-3-methyl-6-methoxy-1,4-benzoquinone monooxygenase [Steroidobacteraceae bacterium]|nr:2-polyprenyl-3-methyl-6-methoxy-1,4-benzoquinone monooxygenase [Steroidobacteraceae bacterium]
MQSAASLPAGAASAAARKPVQTGCQPIIEGINMESGLSLDAAIAALDRALRSVFAPARAARPIPGAPGKDAVALTTAQQRESAALMRVNHSGELAAQALYHGQALVARSATTRALLMEAARGEADHLAWCETRLAELGARPSLLNPLWYAGSFAIGALSALAGDRASLGFVVETERQVERHLDGHLGRLPVGDSRSRAILETMRAEEIQHGATAAAAGGERLPAPVRALMRQTARVMTGTAYWV